MACIINLSQIRLQLTNLSVEMLEFVLDAGQSRLARLLYIRDTGE